MACPAISERGAATCRATFRRSGPAAQRPRLRQPRSAQVSPTLRGTLRQLDCRIAARESGSITGRVVMCDGGSEYIGSLPAELLQQTGSRVRIRTPLAYLWDWTVNTLAQHTIHKHLAAA